MIISVGSVAGRLNSKDLSQRKIIFYKNLMSMQKKNNWKEVPESEIPSCPKVDKHLIASQVLNVESPASSEILRPAIIKKSVSKSLTNLPKSIVEKVLAKESESAAKSAKKKEREAFSKQERLVNLSKFCKNIFVIEKKQALLLEFVKKKSYSLTTRFHQ